MFAPVLIHPLSPAPSLLFLCLSQSSTTVFEMSVNIDFIYLIDIARTDIGTLHKQWRNTLETPRDERKRGGQ